MNSPFWAFVLIRYRVRLTWFGHLIGRVEADEPVEGFEVDPGAAVAEVKAGDRAPELDGSDAWPCAADDAASSASSSRRCAVSQIPIANMP